jgi:hypothetical protein
MSEAPTHHFYIDDSGQRDYAKPGGSYDLRLTRHFVFGGTLLRVPEAARLAKELGALKMHTFGSDRVEVKSSWLRRQDLRYQKYLNPYGISEERLSRFVSDFYDVTGAANLLLLASVVDKVLMTEQYGAARWHTSAAAYEVLVQRLQNELGAHGRVKVFIDRLSGKTKAGNEYEANLRRHHTKLVAEGSKPAGLPITCLHSLPRFIDSSESHLLQVSDVVAYNVLRQVRDHGNAWEHAIEESEMYPWFRKILGKFRHSSRGQIQGYGVIPFPRPKE